MGAASPVKTVLVTGVGSGIGAALAREALTRGYGVLGLSRTLAPDLQGSGVRFCAADLTDLERVGAKIAELLRGVARLDLVVLNAGGLGQMRDMADTPLADIKGLMDLNVWSNKLLLDGIFECVLEVPQVVGISSGAAVSGNRGWGGYALSKATFLMLLKLYAAERNGTHFSSVAPGLVDTGMQDYLCGLPAETAQKYPSVARIQGSRHTPAMPTPHALAPRLMDAFGAVLAQPSGAFVDLRNM